MEAPAVLATHQGTSATPATGAVPLVEFLWEVNGDADARFGIPDGAAVDPQGNLWVTDGANGRFVIVSSEGVVLETWGTLGTGEGEFDFTC